MTKKIPAPPPHFQIRSGVTDDSKHSDCCVNSHKCDRISPLLRHLHWLRVPERMKFRYRAVLVFHCRDQTAPEYLVTESVAPERI